MCCLVTPPPQQKRQGRVFSIVYVSQVKKKNEEHLHRKYNYKNNLCNICKNKKKILQ